MHSLKYTSIEKREFVLGLCPLGILLNELFVRELLLRVLIKIFHIRVLGHDQ